MNLKLKLTGLAILFFAPLILSADINGRFVVSNAGSSRIAVLLQINSLTANTAVGGATIVFGFDTTSISLTNTPVNNVDYVFHNFSGSYYSPGTITRPMKNRVWANIDLPYNNSNHGTILSDTTGWTDVVTIYFDVTDNNTAATLYWLTVSPFWSIYKDDNLTLLSPGSFQNIVYSLVPVELTSFSGAQIGTWVQLSWTTASEVNNEGFELQRMLPGDQDWEALTFIDGNGTTTEVKSYSYNDDFSNEVIHGKISYRLKQVDHNGRFYYSNIIEVGVDFGPQEFTLSQNYPNPFNPSTKIRWQCPVATHQTLKVYDILGNEVATLVDEYRPAGTYEADFNTSSIGEGLASGIYIYRLQTSQYTETRKMVLIR